MNKILISLLVFISISAFAIQDSTFNKLIDKGLKLTRAGEYQASLDVLDTAAQIAKSEKSNSKLAIVLNSKGRNLADMGKVAEGLKIYLEALSLAESSKDKLSMAKIYKNIGALYVEQKDHKTGLDYYKKAEFFASQANDKQLIADILNNKGRIFDEQGKSAEGLELYLKAYTIYKEIKNEERIAMAANNIAIVYKNNKEYEKAARYLEESLAISEKMGNIWVTAANYTNLSNIYSGRKNYTKSIQLNNKAIEMASKINAREITTAAYHNLVDNYEAIGNYKMALEMSRMNSKEKDSLFNSDRTQQLAEMREKYEADKKQDTIRLLAQQKLIDDLKISSQNAEMVKQNGLWAAGILLLIVIVTVSWLLNSRAKAIEKALLEAEILRKENEMQLAVYEAERAERIRIARDMHDELGSGLSKISILTANVMHKASAIPDVNADMDTISKTAKSLVGNMSDLVWALNADDSTLDYLTARLREFMSDFLEDCHLEYNAVFPDEVPNIEIGKEIQRNVFLSFKEILNNTVKHAQASLVKIEYLISGKQIQIQISDNGKGFDVEHVRKYGNGLKNIKTRMERIGGGYSLNSEIGKGSNSILTFSL